MTMTEMRTLAVAAIALTMLCLGCTDAEVSHVMAYGSPQRVRLYSGGVIVEEWMTTGQVLNEGQSDGYVFKDAATGLMVRVSGEVVITLIGATKPATSAP